MINSSPVIRVTVSVTEDKLDLDRMCEETLRRLNCQLNFSWAFHSCAMAYSFHRVRVQNKIRYDIQDLLRRYHRDFQESRFLGWVKP